MMTTVVGASDCLLCWGSADVADLCPRCFRIVESLTNQVLTSAEIPVFAALVLLRPWVHTSQVEPRRRPAALRVIDHALSTMGPARLHELRMLVLTVHEQTLPWTEQEWDVLDERLASVAHGGAS